MLYCEEVLEFSLFKQVFIYCVGLFGKGQLSMNYIF